MATTTTGSAYGKTKVLSREDLLDAFKDANAEERENIMRQGAQAQTHEDAEVKQLG